MSIIKSRRLPTTLTAVVLAISAGLLVVSGELQGTSKASASVDFALQNSPSADRKAAPRTVRVILASPYGAAPAAKKGDLLRRSL